MIGFLKDMVDIGRVLRALGYALAGLKTALAKETAFRQEVALLVVLGPLGVWLGRDGVERALLVGSLLLVPVVELLNSAVETTVNRIGPERHELSGRAKDLGSAAVLFSIFLALIVWALILLDHIGI
jgi:diacylglycerol kinase (ATP)